MILKAFVGLALTGASSLALAQPLPQSTPSSDWATFSAPDAGPPPAAPPPAPMAVPPPPLPPEVPAAAPTPSTTDGGLEVVSTKTVPGPVSTPGTYDAQLVDPINTRLTSSINGPVGVLKVLSAEPGTPGVLRIGLTGQFFTANDFPVQGTNDARELGTLTLGFTPWKFLDFYVGTQVGANDSAGTEASDPPFISELGDYWVGVKVGGFVTKGLGFAIDLRGEEYAGVGSLTVGAGAFLPTGIMTVDVMELAQFPLRFHLNFGGRFGDLTDLNQTNITGAESGLDATERFAWGATDFDSELRLGLGVEIPLPFVTPFVEYNAVFPVVNRILDNPQNTPVGYSAAFPEDLDFGVRVTAVRDVSLLAAIDFTLQQQVAIGIQTLPQWEFNLGIAYNFDLFAENKVTIVERAAKTIEAPVPITGIVAGTVLEQDTKAPVPGALIQATQAPGLVASDSTGHFQTHPLPAGPVDLTATRDGYKLGIGKALVIAGQTVTAEILLEREARPATLKISVHGADKPVAAQVTVTGVDFSQDVKIGDNGQGELAVGKPGSYTLRVSAEGFLSQLHKADVAAGALVPVDIGLSPAPKKTGLIITDKKIRLRRQIHFETGAATILPDSSSILEEVLDAMLAKNVAKLRIEGHTDDIGGEAKNLQLSQDRANAVMQWLIEHGVAADKLEAVGYGDSKPVAPNLTSRGRALNRRVEFDIL